MVKEKYKKNIGTFSEEEQIQIGGKSVCLIGCGGLGGHIAEGLIRMGAGKITIVDGDSFQESNLNRQRFCDVNTIGQNKAAAAKAYLLKVEPSAVITTVNYVLTEDNAGEIIEGHDLVIDATDNIPTRLVLEEVCQKLNLYMIHGGIDGWYGQVAVIPPGGRIVHRMFAEELQNEPMGNCAGRGASSVRGDVSCPYFTPAVVAGIQIAEALKLLSGRGSSLLGKVLYIDILTHDYEILTTE